MKKIALLTSGGDAPGMNAAVRAIVKTCIHLGIIPVGIMDGYQGMVEGCMRQLYYTDVDNIIQLGGTILGSARCESFRTLEGRKIASAHLMEEGIDGLIVIGGDGTYAGANQLGREMNLPIIGLPGTIDNDIYGTDFTIGFDTALNTVVEAVDRIRDTATSHQRVFFVEVMGRDAGFIALHAALATGAEMALIPEEITDISTLIEDIKSHNKGRRSTIVIVAEGDDAGNSLDILNRVKPFLPEFDLRHSVLGHIQRGGSPTAKDRILATRMGSFAVELLISGESQIALGVRGEQLIVNSIEKAIKENASPNLKDIELLSILRTK
jgi:6-phosphofructokinase 1